MKRITILLVILITATSFSTTKFKSCKEARKAGYSHMRKGQPGYSSNLDRDGDGIACDKHK